MYTVDNVWPPRDEKKKKIWTRHVYVLEAVAVTLSYMSHLLSVTLLSSVSMEPKGTIIYSTVGRPYYGFDIFSLEIPSHLSHWTSTSEKCLTDGISINFNAQFISDDQTIVFISDRSGSSRIYMTRPETKTENENHTPIELPSAPGSLFHDRPIIKNGTLYFISAHEEPDKQFQSWSALYSTTVIGSNKVTRLTPYSSVDYSPAVSRSGKYIAVASYGSRIWGGEFHELQSDIVVFPVDDPDKRTVVCSHGGWPTWSGDSTIYFHREADDGWWSVYRYDFDRKIAPRRVTPAGVHSFTPAAFHDGKRIAVATRRRDSKFRHIEIFDETTSEFYPVTELLNPEFHHFNPFVSDGSSFLGYHRFRGEDSPGEMIIPNLNPVLSPIHGIRILRINGFFPTFSPDGHLIAFNSTFDTNSGTKIVRSDGSKRWNLFSGRVAFYNSWSPTEHNVIYTSLGPIFASVKTTVQIARISFNPADLTDDLEDIPVEIKILTKEGTGNNAFPACSPDGKSIVFRSSRSGHKNLYILDSIAGETDHDGIRQLTNGSCIDTMPSWSPDGNLIAFSSNRHNPDDERAFSIYLIHPDGTGLRRVYIAGPEGSVEADRERVNHVCFSADGEWLLFAANLSGVTAEPVSSPNQFQPYGDLYVARVDGSQLQRLTSDSYENGTPAWHVGAEVDLGSVDLSCHVGDKLKNGEFQEPLWIRCDL